MLLVKTGNPLHPFFGERLAFLPEHHAQVPWRVLCDITFARARVNHQPPYSPLFALSLLIAIGKRHWLGLLGLVYLGIFAFLPQDSRYLLPLLPLVSIVAAQTVPEAWRTRVAIVALLPVYAYAAFCFWRQGPLPLNRQQRDEYIAKRVPEYAALRKAGGAKVFVCEAEQLRYYGGYELGRAEDFEYVLVSKRQQCTMQPKGELVYEDAVAALWRTARRSATQV
ncbi:MAG: hypothetical protein JOZ54_12195 [Acidobacteria bacterium]|nr:hypothetical protein [Acidobacteriota bacterium]